MTAWIAGVRVQEGIRAEEGELSTQRIRGCAVNGWGVVQSGMSKEPRSALNPLTQEKEPFEKKQPREEMANQDTGSSRV
jgi:hypothetical protein